PQGVGDVHVRHAGGNSHRLERSLSSTRPGMKSELTSSNGVRLIRVTPGSFIMGSPQTQVGHEFWEKEREVTLPYEFYLGATPVTQRQFELVTGENPTDHPGSAADAPVD